jgi:hypothetical protein
VSSIFNSPLRIWKPPNTQARQSFTNGDMDGEKLILNENLEDEIKFEGKIVCTVW